MINIEVQELNWNIEVKLPIPDIVKRIAEDIKQNLMQSRAISGNSYNFIGGSYQAPAPLNKKYESYKARVYGHTNIFWGRTGDSRNSVKTEIGTTEGMIYIEEPEYTKYVNFGTRKMPQRQFFGISDIILNDIQGIINTKTKLQ